MRVLRTFARLPAPLGDILLFVITVGGYLVFWRLLGNVVDCNAWAGAVGCAVALGWLDSYRRARTAPAADRASA